MNELTALSLSVDGKPHAARPGTTLAGLVESFGHGPDKVSTAVNGLFVPRAQRYACVLQEGDAVLLFQPIVGG